MQPYACPCPGGPWAVPRHPNIIGLVGGLVVEEGGLLPVLELAPYGSLADHMGRMAEGNKVRGRG